MTTVLIVFVALVTVVLGVVAVRARLAAVDAEAVRRGHQVIGSRWSTRVYSSAVWTECRSQVGQGDPLDQVARDVEVPHLGHLAEVGAGVR